MSIDLDERDSLHHVLDYLINARITLEKVEPKKLKAGFYHQWSKPRDDLFQEASIFLRRVLGSRLHDEEMKLLFATQLKENAVGADILATIANAIRSYLPLFMQKSRSEYEGKNEVIVRIIEDFMGIYWADEPRFFSSWPRRQGLHKRPYRIARLRLTALNWNKHLAVVGLSAHERHRIVADAYRTDWDAIRKWQYSTLEQFDLYSYPPKDAERAISTFLEKPDAIFSSIRRDGDAYWSERSTAQAGKEK